MYFVVFLMISTIAGELSNESIAICNNLICNDTGEFACGMRIEETGFRIKLFESECELLKHGCGNGGENAYGLINREFCESENQEQRLAEILLEDECGCEGNHTTPLCAIRKDGEGFRVRWFENKCELIEHNCRNTIKYHETDDYICESNNNNTNSWKLYPNYKGNLSDNSYNDKLIPDDQNITNLVIVKAKFNINNINDTIDKFFATTHIYDVPLKEIHSRRKWIKNAGPINVFTPLKIVPENLTDDFEHKPLLRTCLHKCPTSCPSVYAPVCGQTAYDTRSPTLMFQNHCFMDVASCKTYWEDNERSSYWESLIVFCLGDEMDAAYRFIPAIRTLQKMGRLKKKGKFRRQIKNFRYLTDIRSGPIKPMG